jgi:hypothetical protein
MILACHLVWGFNKERGDIEICPFICMDTLARWHPWPTKKGIRHLGTLWQDGAIWIDQEASYSPRDAEEAIQIVGRQQMYVFCSDPLDQEEFSFSDDLLLKSDTYMQKAGKVVAVRVKSGRHCGFFIPARTWGFAYPSFEMIETIREIFSLFDIEAITPASLSEKVLRSTMADKIAIFRPAHHLRKILLENNGGGRIDLKEVGEFYPKAYKYDINKAYLFFSQEVPCPLFPPKYHVCPREEWLWDHATPGYWKVTMIAHGLGIHPIFLDNEGKKRFPREGEQFTKWLWRDEIIACCNKGYTLLYIHEGYRWLKSSDFLKPWGDLLWDKFQSVSCETLKRIIKSMMVGFPGKCLAEPYNYLLIPLGQRKEGDIPITHNWFNHMDNWQDENKKFFTNWYLRKEYNEESTALTPIGASILKDCRLEIYRLTAIEEAKGNRLISTYIDCAVFEHPASSLSIGPLPGQYKEEKLVNCWAEENRVIAEINGEVELRAPGHPAKSEERLDLLRKYNQFRNDPKYC